MPPPKKVRFTIPKRTPTGLKSTDIEGALASRSLVAVQEEEDNTAHSRAMSLATRKGAAMAADVRAAMLGELMKVGVSRSTFVQEVLSVCRAAAAEGEYVAALKGYELVGKTMGAFVENHNHLHITGSVSDMKTAMDLQGMSDGELEALAAQKAKDADILVA